jgi:hypothetical protein
LAVPNILGSEAPARDRSTRTLESLKKKKSKIFIISEKKKKKGKEERLDPVRNSEICSLRRGQASHLLGPQEPLGSSPDSRGLTSPLALEPHSCEGN